MEKFNEYNVLGSAGNVGNIGTGSDTLRFGTTVTAAGTATTTSTQVNLTAGRDEAATTDTLWLAMHVNNNNNNAVDVTQDDSSSHNRRNSDDVFANDKLQQQQQQQKHNAEQLNAQKRWKRRVSKPLLAFCEAVGVSSNQNKCNITNTVMPMEPSSTAVTDKGGGNVVSCGSGFDDQTSQQEQTKQNGAGIPTSVTGVDVTSPVVFAEAVLTTDGSCGAFGGGGVGVGVGGVDYESFMVGAMGSGANAGATSLTPPEHTHSNRTSVNNSTENLSYSSDNYYGDDLILLDDEEDDDVGDVDADDDVEAEEISLNSDDCVYAYRGDGADFDLAVDAYAGRGGRLDATGMIDDETDFLEMDFEPDPLSEIEYGFVSMSGTPAEASHADAFLLQRDACHVSARHAAQRQHFSSPINEMSTLTTSKTPLQSQALLNKNFARITLHLDQIKGEMGDYDCLGHSSRSERLSALGVDDLTDGVDMAKLAAEANTPSAHSLPNTLHAHFVREPPEHKEIRNNASKVTGAKPKRLSTFSTSSSTSSKNSSKSRTSLRSAYALPLCNSSSFDERSVSCAEFRSAGVGAVSVSASNATTDDCLPGCATAATVVACLDFAVNEETCLDCLEKEFLANTIGKTLEPHVCPKCRRRSGGGGGSGGINSGNIGWNSNRGYFARAEQTHCRSGSPSFFLKAREDDLFEPSNEFLQTHNSQQLTVVGSNGNNGNNNSSNNKQWQPRMTTSKSKTTLTHTNCALQNGGGSADGVDGSGEQSVTNKKHVHDCVVVAGVGSGGESGGIGGGSGNGSGVSLAVTNQRRIMCDNFKDEQLLQNFLLTENEIVKISTVNLTEETLVQALDKLHIVYNAELLKSHFRCNSSTSNLHKTSVKDFKNLKHFLLHESKKYGNHKRLKRVIELITHQKVNVQFKKDLTISQMEMVNVKVTDILHQWTRTKNLELLKQLDKRFMDANILGKIANIIRQAEQCSATRRPLPESISIPQYYPSGYLILTKKC